MRLDGTFEDKDGEAGTNGQVLSSTTTGTDWIDAPGGVIAMGKIGVGGNIIKATPGITASGSGGIYIIDVSALSLPDADYIINATIFDTSTVIKSIIISDQQTNQFTVNIAQVGGGTIASGFFFTITDL